LDKGRRAGEERSRDSNLSREGAFRKLGPQACSVGQRRNSTWLGNAEKKEKQKRQKKRKPQGKNFWVASALVAKWKGKNDKVPSARRK